MKKTFSLLLCAFLLAGTILFGACGGTGKNNRPETTSAPAATDPPASEEAVTPAPETTEAPTETPETTEAPTAPATTERYIVSKEDVPDCDGKGGYYVITWSDGDVEYVEYTNE